jgi:hypothetical protein
MSYRGSKLKTIPEHLDHSLATLGEHIDAEFGGTDARLVLERRLLRKLDLRMSILIFIYILNYVSILVPRPFHVR